MTRFERFGFLRVLSAGLAFCLILTLHLFLMTVEVVGVGVGLVYGWRKLGDWLHSKRTQSDWKGVRL